MRLFRVVIFALLSILNLEVFLLIGSGFNLFQCLFCMLIVIPELIAYKKRKEIKSSKVSFVFMTIFVAVMVGWFSCFVFGFGKMGIYELKIKYADMAGYTTKHFPQNIPEGAVLTDMGLLPTIMQGDGNIHATFIAAAPVLNALEKKASAEAVMSFSAEQYLKGDIPEEYQKKAQEIFEEKYDFKDTQAQITVTASKIIYGQQKNENEPDDIMIYIIDSNFYWNHIRTDSVIVDHASGLIEYIGQ
ncbi:MAG: hypothetical protein K5877_00630 [Lachnospiraceae bacterium]|nr:hypothetical protein [Lachnospiraceae bacterium]